MSAVLKTLIITICINFTIALAFFMFGVGGSLGGYDALGSFFSMSNTSMSPSDNYASSIPTTTDEGGVGVEGSTSLLSFIDGLKLVFNFILLLLICLFLPPYWGLVFGLPIYITGFLCILSLTSIASMIMVIRGVSP